MSLLKEIELERIISVKHGHPCLLQLQELSNGTSKVIYWNLGKLNKQL